MRVTLWIGDGEGDLKFEFGDEAQWADIHGQIDEITRSQNGSGIVRIDEGPKGVFFFVLNQGTRIHWRLHKAAS